MLESQEQVNIVIQSDKNGKKYKRFLSSTSKTTPGLHNLQYSTVWPSKQTKTFSLT